MRHLKVPLAVVLSLALSFLLLLFPPFQSGEASRPLPQAETEKRGVDFVYEKIIVDIEPPELRVTGLYRFLNRFPFEVTLPMLYPFPVDQYQDFPHEISAKSVTVNGELPIAVRTGRKSKAVYLAVTAEGESTAEMKVTYTQRLKGKQARYILTTTAAWGKPLESADYQIILPQNLKLESISFPFDRVESIGVKRVYSAHKDNFMPNVDLIVEWM